MIAANDNEPVRYGPWLPTRAIAKRLGAKHYYGGRHCKHGHAAPHFVSDMRCVECHRLRRSLWRGENKELAATQIREWKVKNADHVQQYNRDWKDSRPGYFLAYGRKWVANNPERARAQWRARRGRELNAEGHHTAEDVELILKLQRNRCAICKMKLDDDRHIDHITALSKGGTNWPRNLQALCPLCNGQKYNHDPLIFARRKGLIC
jgi:5-methylcytosine-specific restriction endonuclease McrA